MLIRKRSELALECSAVWLRLAAGCEAVALPKRKEITNDP